MQTIHTIGICGVGQMGASAAVSFKRSGYRVLAWDHDPAQLGVLHRTMDTLEHWLDQNLCPAGREGGTIQTEADPGPIDEQADIILDCIAEDMADKVELFKRQDSKGN